MHADCREQISRKNYFRSNSNNYESPINKKMNKNVVPFHFIFAHQILKPPNK